MQELWSAALPLLRQQVGERNFLAWIEPIRCAGAEHQVQLEVPNRFFQDWVTQNFLSTIADTINRVAGQPRAVRLIVNQCVVTRPRTAECVMLAAAPPRSTQRNGGEVTKPAARNPKIGRLVPHYTFDGFVVGPSNEVAFKAAKTVSAQPGQRFNPVFLHGGVGLGKTHLINAIAHDLLARFPRMRLACMPAEDFMNVLIGSMRNQQMDAFRDRFREVDALVLDDIQFLAGKERTQEEFFHTFNALHSAGKQIVLTSDKKPAAINGLEHRLRSRFEGGMIADIKPPTLEMRRSILCAKASRHGMELQEDVVEYLARTTGPSVRELEGALTRLTANATVRGVPLTLALAEELLGPLQSLGKVSVEAVQDTVSRHFGLTVSDLKSERRGRDITLPRQIAMYLSRTVASASFPSIAEKFERDHSTVMHAVRVIESRRSGDPSLARLLSDLDIELHEQPPTQRPSR
jgi:chromosomal replication initiator protein